MMLKERIQQVFEWLVILLFLGAITAPMIQEIRVGTEEALVTTEFRKAAEQPQWAWRYESLVAWSRDYPSWYKDVFGWRALLLRWHNLIKVYGFSVSPVPSVLVGEDRWLFFTGQSTIENHRGLIRPDEAHIRSWTNTLNERARFLASGHIPFYFVVAPDKETIYRERLPWRLHASDPSTILDHLLPALRQVPAVRVIDLRPDLLEAKQHELVYYPHGTHWNGAGALVGYRAMLRAISNEFPGTQPLDESELDLRWHVGVYDSWAERLRIDDLMQQPVVDVFRRGGWRSFEAFPRTPGPADYRRVGHDGSKPRLLVFHDSFFQALRVLFAEHFSVVDYVWDQSFDPQVVRTLKPDLVIWEVVERDLVHLPAPDRGPLQGALDSRHLDLAGTFENPRWGRLNLSLSGSDLRVQIGSMEGILNLNGTGHREFKSADGHTWSVTPHRDAAGNIWRISFSGQQGQFIDFVAHDGSRPREGPALFAPGLYASFDRLYVVTFTGTRWVIFDADGVLQDELEPLADGSFISLRDRSRTLRFAPPQNNVSPSFLVSLPLGTFEALRVPAQATPPGPR